MRAKIQAAEHIEIHPDVSRSVGRCALSLAVADLQRESASVTAESVHDFEHRGEEFRRLLQNLEA